MQLDSAKLQEWINSIEYALPHVLNCTAAASGRILILGANVLQIYQGQGWITRARATGDLDISMGLVASAEEYHRQRELLLKRGYKATDPDRHFRLYSPLKSALNVSYVDLLAHPEGSISDRETRAAIGVGDSWPFDIIKFACEEAYAISHNTFIPNPMGFLALKQSSYSDDPRRVRDIVDIVDVVFGLVRKGLHYELEKTWRRMAHAQPTCADVVRKMLNGVISEAIEWDFQPAQQEFTSRGYDFDQLEADAPLMFGELLEAIEAKE